MRPLGPVSEAEVVSAFLLAEIGSKRFKQCIEGKLAADGRDRTVILKPNNDDEDENLYRDSVLARCRGWRATGLFTGFPPNVMWQRITLDRAELPNVRYINEESWRKYSDDTRSPIEALKLRRFGAKAKEAIREIGRDIRAGRMPPEIILVGTAQEGTLVALEGNARLTALVQQGDHLREEIDCYLGTSDGMEAWSFW